MAHVLLPASSSVEPGVNPYKYANRAIPAMMEAMLKSGAYRPNLSAKIAGGSMMFRNIYADEKATVGYKNVEAVKTVLGILKIPLVGEDTGGEHGRTMTAELYRGSVTIKVLGKETNTF